MAKEHDDDQDRSESKNQEKKLDQPVLAFPTNMTFAQMTELLFRERRQTFSGNIKQTADSLGITVKTAYNWDKRFKVKGL